MNQQARTDKRPAELQSRAYSLHACRFVDNQGAYEKVQVVAERVDALVQEDVLLLKLDVEVSVLGRQ